MCLASEEGIQNISSSSSPSSGLTRGVGWCPRCRTLQSVVLQLQSYNIYKDESKHAASVPVCVPIYCTVMSMNRDAHCNVDPPLSSFTKRGVTQLHSYSTCSIQ